MILIPLVAIAGTASPRAEQRRVTQAPRYRRDGWPAGVRRAGQRAVAEAEMTAAVPTACRRFRKARLP